LARKIPIVVKKIKNHNYEKINYGYQNHISYSQLSMFNSCPHKWALQYRDGHKIYSPSIHTVFGNAIHETLQHYLTVMYDQSGAAADKENIIEIFENKLREDYAEQYKKSNNQHFSSGEELREFFEDGKEILNFITKKRSAYFSKRGWYLVGCEVPIVITPNNAYRNVIYQGYLDVVLYHEPTDTFKIIDIKTSTRGWNDKMKKNEDKQFQLILYKKFFSEQFGIPEKSIDIEFLITRRKVYVGGDYPQKRIQEFRPASGRNKTNKATKSLNKFIETAFDKNGYKDKKYFPKPSKWNCTFCPFKEDKELCNAVGKNL
jgi:hypothetical protein